MNEPMEIDPVDDGPSLQSSPPPPHQQASPRKELFISKEEEARQAIELLRGDDVAGRVAAANKLDAIAAALGQERTREVRRRYFISYTASDRDSLIILHFRFYTGTPAFSH